MIWFLIFFIYSFLGFLLELAYARSTGGHPARKCLLVLPLCPVYGLGALSILLLPAWATQSSVRLLLFGALAATVAEYLTAFFYERVLGVSFWNYDALPGSLHGRVCLPFSLAWGVLSLPLVYGLHPWLFPWLMSIPAPIAAMALATVLADSAVSGFLLWHTGDRNCLNWYAAQS